MGGPVNKYFSAYDEIESQRLYRQLIDECLDFYGLNSTYIPRDTLSEFDLLFGDDPTKIFTAGFALPVLITTTKEFDGDIAAFSKFGLVINKQLRLLVSYDRFQQSTESLGFNRPREGDLIWMHNFNAFFEIKFVNQDTFFYAFGNSTHPFYGYELILEQFRYNNEIVDSGVKEADQKIKSLVFTYVATMEGGNVSYQIGEQVYQGTSLANSSAQANVSAWNFANATLELFNIQGMFVPTMNIIGQSSNAQWELVSIELYDDVNNELENNLLIRNEANTDLDQTESDPFGNPVTSIIQE